MALNAHATMTPSEFIAKWGGNTLSERSASHEHFMDLCALVDHPSPAAVDTTGDEFTFEKGVTKEDGGGGWADVWKKGCFGWEYKGPHKDLDEAYRQLRQYREALENPPLLVVSDMDRIVVHTNFTATVGRTYDIPLEALGEPQNLEVLHALFHEPGKLRPGTTSAEVTEEAARRLGDIAQGLRGRGLDAHEVARFLDRIVFCLFAEDVGLLPKGLFTEVVNKAKGDPPRFKRQVERLFSAMADGGDFGPEEIKHFNGDLFSGSPVLELTPEEITAIHAAAKLDWSAVDASIFGTLFERGMDPDKRSQIGAHYTSREDIETLVEPVVMWPLRREWEQVRGEARGNVERLHERLEKREKEGKGRPRPRDLQKWQAEAAGPLTGFLDRLGKVKVLDPACGSGNFLYVSLQKLKDLEKEVCIFADNHGIGGLYPRVGPWQLYGIEINEYACELAQMTVWIGFLQWTIANGYGNFETPLLRKMPENFQCKDAILDLSDRDNPKEPEWPAVDYVVGNPPFLGGKKLRSELGDAYVDALLGQWGDRVRPEADLCCYWLERARNNIERGLAKRAGLLATQGVRGGASRETLKRIRETGNIFFAESDRPWILDGANVHVSMVGIDSGSEKERLLDGKSVATINANLTALADVTKSQTLSATADIAFMGTTKGGAFDVPFETAVDFLVAPNPHLIPNSNVVVPWVNGKDITSRGRNFFIVDFGVGMPSADAARYQAPFEYLRTKVKGSRQVTAREHGGKRWWQHTRPRSELRTAILGFQRYTCTPRVSKHRLFVRIDCPTLPDSATIAFARSDDYFFGVLHSRLHEVWARAQGTQLRERESGFRYTPTTCFETFPFPGPTAKQEAAIGAAAKELDDLRNNWLNPPEWVTEEVLEFPGSADGPWARFVHDPDERGIGTVRYPRLVPRHEAAAKQLKKRTLTNLYNERPTWLDLAHRKLDEAVFAAYGWDPAMSDEDLLAALLELNLARAAAEELAISR